MSFEEFGKIPRLRREVVITEKIDGTNGQVHIVPAVDRPLLTIDSGYVLAEHQDGSVMLAGSRTRYIVPIADNYGFAVWVKANAGALWALGPGRHYGEWWGAGIQRGYGLKEKRFSLFNVGRWNKENLPSCVGVVPTLYSGVLSNSVVDSCLDELSARGSFAAPGFMRPEGIVVYHTAARALFKVTLEKDDEPKGKSAA